MPDEPRSLNFIEEIIEEHARTGRFGESKRIVEQGFGRADLNEQRCEPFQIGIDR